MEEGELPAVERLEQLDGRLCEPRLQLRDERRPKRVETRRVAGGHLGRGRGDRPDPVGAVVEALEDDRPGGDGARRCEPESADSSSELAGSIGNDAGRRLELALELQDKGPVDLAPEVAREQAASLRPGRRELADGCGANADAVSELDCRSGGHADERSDGRVCAPVAEEGALEPRVGSLEGGVVPVEAAAGLRRGDEDRDEDRAPERLVLAHALVRVRVGEDPRGRLVLEDGERLARVLAEREAPGALLDEGADQRTVLVERRAVGAAVLLERDGDVGAALQLEA